MKKEELKELTSEELIKKAQSIKTITLILVVVLIILFAVTIYQSIKEKKLDSMLAVPIALSAILPMNYKNLKLIREELDHR